MLSAANKRLGDEFTLSQVKAVYKAIEETVEDYLNDLFVTVKLSRGLSVSSIIKDSRRYTLYGERITSYPKKWIVATVPNHYNRQMNEELTKEANRER